MTGGAYAMRAVRVHEFGGPEQVRVDDGVQDPRAGAGEAVLEVRGAALNHLDIWVRKGRAQAPLPHVLGSDAAGVVAEIGEGVENVHKGDEVMLYPGLVCLRCEACRRGQHSECEHFSIIGVSRPGTFAQRVAVPAVNLHRKPDYLTFEHAASLGVAYLTAWRMLTVRGQLLPGQSVLIHGIGGGVALAALQLATQAGAEVIVTSSSTEKLGRAKLLGAAHGIDYANTQDVAAAVREVTRGRGVDLAIDAVGAATWPIDIASVRKGGRVVICGVTTGAEAKTDLRTVYWNQLTVMGSTLCSLEEFRQFVRMLELTELEPEMDSTYPLDQARQAMERMEAGEQYGKIALTVGA